MYTTEFLHSKVTSYSKVINLIHAKGVNIENATSLSNIISIEY